MKEIQRPTLVVHRQRALRNISMMAEKAEQWKVILRPHFKTHQSVEIGTWFTDAGVTKITVSSVMMAEYFAAAGWDDITIAFPVNILEAEQLDSLAASIRLGLLVDSPESVRKLDHMLKHKAFVWIKIDTGYHRSGVLWTAGDTLAELLETIRDSRHLVFRGLLTHSGQSYHTRGRENHARLFTETAGRLQEAKNSLPPEQQDGCLLSLGDTPTCTASESFEGIDEVRPGNFVFYDIQQLMLGSCTEKDIAAAAVCPVVGVYPDRGEVVIYGGAVHLSKQFETLPDGTRMYGFAVPWSSNGWEAINPDWYVRDVSQEHGIIRFGGPPPVKPGDLLAILPVHSCLTMNLLKGSVEIL